MDGNGQQQHSGSTKDPEVCRENIPHTITFATSLNYWYEAAFLLFIVDPTIWMLQ